MPYRWYEWIASQPATVSLDDQGNYVVWWLGLPGCRPDPTRRASYANGPAFVDSLGNECYTLWLVDVRFNGEYQPVEASINDAGGVP